VARCGAEDAALTFHSVDPSMANGAPAFLHAASCRLPLPSVRAAAGAGAGAGALQLCLLARSPAGLVVTVVPAFALRA
jgi:hypothetical protein